MKGLFTQFSLRFAQQRPGRTLGAVFGVALGVVMIVATQMASDAALSSFTKLKEVAAGKTALQVLPGAGSGFAEEVLDDVADAEGVAGAYPLVTGQSRVVRDGADVDALLVLGVDTTSDREVRDYDLVEGEFIQRDAPQVLISARWAERLGYRVGDPIELLTADGVREFEVTGLLSDSGIGRMNAGRFAVVPLSRAQAMLSRSGRLDGVDVVLEPSADIESVESALGDMLGGGLLVQRPASRGKDVTDSLESFRLMLSFTGSISLVVGLLIIFNNMSVSVEERRYHLAMLRALGARRGWIMRMVLGEALALGVVGGGLGLVLGIGMAKLITMGMAELSESLSRVSITELGLSARTVMLALVVGPGTALLASIGPAWGTLRVDPLEALAPVERDRGPTAVRLRIAGWVTAFAGVGALVAFSTPSLVAMQDAAWSARLYLALCGAFLLTAGIVLLLPWLLAVTLGRLRVRSMTWRTAIDNLVRSPARTSATAAGMMLALAIVVAVAAQSDAIERYARGWIEDVVGWDLLVSSSFEGANASVPVDPEVTEWVRGSDSVAHAAALRFTTVVFRDTRVVLHAFEMEELQHFVHWSLAQGDQEPLRERLASGKWVVVSQQVAARFGVTAGETIDLPTPGGPARLGVAGVVKDFTGDTGAIYIDQPAYARLWGDERVDAYDVKLADGVRVSDAVRELESAVGERTRLVISTRQQFTADVLGVVEQSMGLTNVVAYVAVLVAAAGIMNTALISLMQRRRELALLRALGTRRSGVGRLLLYESVIVGVVGAVLGDALGVVLALAILQGGEQFGGVVYEFRMPWVALAVALGLGAGLGAVASLVPRRAAARSDLVAGLRYE